MENRDCTNCENIRVNFSEYVMVCNITKKTIDDFPGNRDVDSCKKCKYFRRKDNMING